MKLRHLLTGRKPMTNLDSILKCRDIALSTKVRTVKARLFPVVMYKFESRNIKKPESKNWRFQTVVPEKTLESPLGCKEIKPVNPKGYQSWIFIGRTDAKTEDPVLWPPDVKSQLIGKDPNIGKDWGQEEKGATEDEMVGWHHWLNGHESEQALGVVKDRRAWCAAVHGVTKSQTWLSNWTELNELEGMKIWFQENTLCYLSKAWVSYCLTRGIPWSSYVDFNLIPTFLLVFSHFFHVYCSYLCMCLASLVAWQILDSFSLPKVMMITKYVCSAAL